MALHFLLDGYNLLYALDEIPRGSLQEKRETLLRRLAREAPYGKNRVSVVFDSREGPGNQSRFGAMDVTYTAGETADDWISRYIRRAANPRILVVVTNDKGLQRMVRGTGAKVMGAVEFWRKSMGQTARSADQAPPWASDAITDEFKKRWL